MNLRDVASGGIFGFVRGADSGSGQGLVSGCKNHQLYFGAAANETAADQGVLSLAGCAATLYEKQWVTLRYTYDGEVVRMTVNGVKCHSSFASGDMVYPKSDSWFTIGSTKQSAPNSPSGDDEQPLPMWIKSLAIYDFIKAGTTPVPTNDPDPTPAVTPAGSCQFNHWSCPASGHTFAYRDCVHTADFTVPVNTFKAWRA